MHRTVHEAEDGAGHQQPAAPEQQPGPDPCGTRGPPGEPQTRKQTDQCGGQQPRRLRTHRRPEQPADAGIAAEEQIRPAVPTRTAGTTEAAVTVTAFTTGDSFDPVVPERKLEQAVVGRSGDVG